MARTNKVILIAGARGTGKTDFVKKLYYKSRNNFPKALLVDVFDSDNWHNLEVHDHPEWKNQQVDTIPLRKFQYWKAGYGRMYSGDAKEMMNLIQKFARNSFIVFEDAIRYIKSKLSEDESRFLFESKQKNLDLVFIYHALGQIPPDLLRAADILVLFKTNEGAPCTKKYPWEEIPQMMKELKKEQNRYSYRVIQLN